MGDNSVMEFLIKYYEFLNESHGEINYTDYGAYIFSLSNCVQEYHEPL